MQNGIKANLYLDKRRKKKDGTYPLKLYVYSSDLGRFQYYNLGQDVTEEAFDKSYNATKPRDEYKTLQLTYKALEKKALDIASTIEPFTFEAFERRMFRSSSDAKDVLYHYQVQIEKMREHGQLATANKYELSIKSISKFAAKGKTAIKALPFHSVTPDFLKRYERWMTDQGRSLTTVGFYVRAMRTIFNNAISDGDIQSELYPFGKRKYQVPAARNVKKALNKEQLRTLFEFDTEDWYKRRARAFWFYSFQCNGINTADIAELKNSDCHTDKIVFTRIKTRTTTKGNSRPIVAYRTPYLNWVMKEYGNNSTSPNDYVFPIYEHGMTNEQKLMALKRFTRFVNQHIKRLAKDAGLPTEISTYWARHSYATASIRNGASMEEVSEDLGHSNLKTTQLYFSGFDDEMKRERAMKLMDFINVPDLQKAG